MFKEYKPALRFCTVALLSVSVLALDLALSPQAVAQTAAPATEVAPTGRASPAQLPPVSITAPDPATRRRRAASRSAAVPAGARATRRVAATAPPAPAVRSLSQDARTGAVGIYANSTSSATKTNTPLLNIPQSVNVLTKEYIKDQSFPGLTDVTRYVPGVAIHQGEGNRDELVIRGVDSSANFFVNGFRDDVQYFRDLYNAQSVEVLKGPSALIFGRGAGGGLVNRTLKEADGARVYEATLQGGSYSDRRFTLDAGQAINPDVAVRLNAMYEGSGTFRQYGQLERYGLNPTVTLKPNDTTQVKLSYEYFHDERTADRGNPSQALNNAAPSSTRFNPAAPFAPGGDLTAFFGSPGLSSAHVDVQTAMVVVDHDFENGLTVRNGTLYSDFNRGYQNIYPGNGTLSGAVNTTDTSFNRAAYNNTTDRENAFNQTDFIYKTATGPVLHTLAFGTEFGRQTGISLRNTGFFPTASGGLSNTVTANPFAPTYFGPVTFQHIATDANSKYRLNIASGYVQDQIEVTRWLQFIAGVRYDSFDLAALDQNTGILRNRTDEKLSPRAAVIVKPIDNLSIYGSYSISYLPASGDQFSALSSSTVLLDPQKFDNKEVGVKWNIMPRLQYTAAVYQLDRSNVPLANPNGDGTFFLSGKNRIRGFETGLTGYVTDAWQASVGYAYTDARITSDTSATIVAGNRVQLVPFNQFSFWNKYQIDPIWGAGLGVIYFSDSYASSDNSVRLPGFVRVDAALYVKINETWRGQLNIENILDKGYWASADGNNNLSPGLPRTFRVSATAKF
ncbi:TonB-dependent siderophore receptor [Tardiphaga sp. vice154]|uniref:TonB-dependent receptor n=1 Tax=Tardiphaga sp. vice154 TaxID=2592814 RepID=UPI0011659E66|nr:TonB-dependent siderophore receptor [Tardiphaga sp. vice154]QDM24190.1 TonB-dependent siderophore receptor [Tardiphaga sp. vice154]